MLLSETYKSHYKINFKLAYPVMMSQLGHVLVGVVDSLMVGQLGEVPLAASSLANSVFFFFMCFGIGVSYGITPLVAQINNPEEGNSAPSLLKSSLFINLIIAAIIFVIVLFMIKNLHLLGQDKFVVIAATPYLWIISLSIIPFMIFQTLRQFAEGLSFTKQAMFIILISNFVNIILNYLLIFGNMGFPNLGLQGAGWATFISRIVMVILMVLLVKNHTKMSRFVKGFWQQKRSLLHIKELLNIGIPSGLQFSFEVSAFVVAAIMMGWLGASALAAHQIAISLATISYMMASGLATAATIRVGNQLARKDYQTLRDAVFSIFVMVIVFELIWTFVFIIGKDFLPTLYINDVNVLNIASKLMVMAAFFQLSDGLQVVGLGALRGLSDTKIPTIYTLFAYWVFGLPMGYILAFQFNIGSEGVWIGLIIGLTVTAMSLFFRFNSISKKLITKNNTNLKHI